LDGVRLRRGRAGSTHAVLDASDDDGIGCVSIHVVSAADANPAADRETYSASVRSRVPAAGPPLDELLWRAVSDWLRETWPFGHVGSAEQP